MSGHTQIGGEDRQILNLTQQVERTGCEDCLKARAISEPLSKS